MLQIALNDDSGYFNKISLSKIGLKRFTPVIPKVITITRYDSEERSRVERFIETQFKENYNATIQQHYPMLMSVHDDEDNILAALGFRSAQDDSLFLEQYIDCSIESSINKQFDTTVSREEIVEIGNLASMTSGASIFLFIALNAWLEQQGYKIATITATHRLARYFSSLKLDFIQIEEADPERLPDHGKQWGSYYKTKPRILAGSISQTQSRMNKVLDFHLIDDPISMQAHLHSAEDTTPNE